MGKLEFAGLTKSFGHAKVIRETDLTVEDGEFVVFVGPSGCGKSTMLRMIAGLDEITGGELRINGRVVNDVAPVDRGIAMVFQSYALYPHMTVFENIAFPLQVAKLPEAEIRRRVAEAAAVLKLEERLAHKPAALSGGQRQRVAIGRAIVREPAVFLFDEPLSNLDAALRAEMRVELTRLHAKLGTTMIYVTHDQVEAMTMADKIVVLRDGVVEQVGSPLELFHRPANRFVAGFLGNPTMNFLPAEATGTAAGGIAMRLAGAGEVTVPVEGGAAPGEALELGIRPDDLRLGAGEVRFRVVPEVIEQLGNQSVVYGAAETGQAICAVVSGGFGLRPGVAAEFGFDPAAAHLFRQDGAACPRRVVPGATVAA
ncbi:ABC transporter ATP-binding protein [Mangrovicoccus algicola]|uniref:sn-glycerol-3-phosphate ABC transporter ATP-binding protein UgpC n=1 Tax=Mangrovicoccus algicola TaxID=2771008 RepID=A0A8J6Z178_9RHOB|nr:sn-glycerol-3-phosphate ABC transporter ATP-binding protein UgpC [Mangrovicoccus algicola]MBE3639636.1 sn-glycerol-3-phosphate ABC transporter ATP-binding protein UgpC [Mangrovicoccus algicola]